MSQALDMFSITQEEVRQLFEYRDGSLYWKAKVGPNTVIGSCAGSKGKSGYTRVGLGGRNYRLHRCVLPR